MQAEILDLSKEDVIGSFEPVAIKLSRCQEKALRSLDKKLQHAGYYHIYLSFGDGNTRFQEISRVSSELNLELRVLLDLFLFGRDVPKEAATAILGDEILSSLEDLNLVSATNENISFGSYRLIKFRNLTYIFEFSANPQAYFGDDSIALAIYQAGNQGAKTLDLCCGPGVQMLISAQTSELSLGVEINKVAASLAAVNVAINEFSTRAEIYNGDLRTFAPSLRHNFDLITFNPPLLPIPSDLEYPFVGDGGTDGMEITRDIIKNYSPYLTDGGSIFFIGTTLTTDARAADLKRILTEIGNTVDLVPQVVITSHNTFENGNAFFETLISTTSSFRSQNAEAVRRSFLSHISQTGQNQFVTFSCAFKKRGVNGFSIDLSETYYGGWFV